jgi:hypothetical protein
MKKSVFFNMAGYLSSSQISKIEFVNNKLHETFAQNITVYKNAKKTLIAHNPSYNAIYGRMDSGKKDNIQYEMISETFDARVYYVNNDEEHFFNDKSQTKIILPRGSVKIVVKEDGFKFLIEARRVELDGKSLTIKSDGVPFGITGNLFYSFYLSPVDE